MSDEKADIVGERALHVYHCVNATHMPECMCSHPDALLAGQFSLAQEKSEL